MLLTNFCAAISAPIGGSNSSNKIIRATNGFHYAITSSPRDIGSVSGNFYDDNGGIGFSFGHSKGIVLGSGTTPPKYSDYKMENWATGLTYSNNSATWNNPNVILTQSATNNTKADIVVTEVGMFGMDSDSNTGYDKVLYTRNVIDPVTIKPGETKTFTIKIDFSKFSDAYSST